MLRSKLSLLAVAPVLLGATGPTVEAAINLEVDSEKPLRSAIKLAEELSLASEMQQVAAIAAEKAELDAAIVRQMTLAAERVELDAAVTRQIERNEEIRLQREEREREEAEARARAAEEAQERAEAEARAAEATRRAEREARSAEAAVTVTVPSATTTPPAGGDDIAARIRKCESNNKNVRNSQGSSASGYYQFIDSTWEHVTGLPAPAMAHSFEEQHAAFLKLWDEGRGASHWAPSRHCWG